MSFIEDFKNIFRGRNNGLIQLIIIHVILFVLSNLFFGFAKISGYDGTVLERLLGLPPDFSVFISRPWSLLTHLFLHHDIFHLLFNMLWLYWMGQLFVEFVGSKKLISTYLMGGICGGLLFLIYGTLFPVTGSDMPLIGASAAVMAIVIAIAFFIPNYQINVFLLGAVKLKYIALVAFVLSLLDIYNNTGGKIAHIGGALYGYLFYVQHKKGRDPGAFLTSFFAWVGKTMQGRNLKVVKPDRSKLRRSMNDEEYNMNKRAVEKRVDEILDKISRSGYDSLSKEEKDFLFRQGGR